MNDCLWICSRLVPFPYILNIAEKAWSLTWNPKPVARTPTSLNASTWRAWSMRECRVHNMRKVGAPFKLLQSSKIALIHVDRRQKYEAHEKDIKTERKENCTWGPSYLAHVPWSRSLDVFGKLNGVIIYLGMASLFSSFSRLNERSQMNAINSQKQPFLNQSNFITSV